jgi:hypothetical protein
VAAPMADHNDDVDIVERALAILDEEARSWVSRQRGLGDPPDPNSPSGDAK